MILSAHTHGLFLCVPPEAAGPALLSYPARLSPVPRRRAPAPTPALPSRRPSPFITTNNFGGGFADEQDRVAMSAMKFGSAESAGATSCVGPDGGGVQWMEASMEQLCIPLPPYALRAGARETIYFNPLESKIASEQFVWVGWRAFIACGFYV